MDSDINWLHLPAEIWEIILSNLEAKHLLKASETCKQFNDLLSKSQLLIKKLCLEIGSIFMQYHIRNDGNAYEKYFCELNLMKECLQKLERKYEKIRICAILDFEQDDMIDVIYDILKQLEKSVKQITFYNSTLQDDEFFKMIQIMKNLKVLKFRRGRFCDEATSEIQSDTFPTINEIYIEQVKGFSFEKLYLFDNLTTLDF